ncbi:MAG: GGDEF domain-containing protein [Gaiellaceae bacterium]
MVPSSFASGKTTPEERELGRSIAYELRDVARGSFAALYVSGAKGTLTLLGATAPDTPARAPAVARRSLVAGEPVVADGGELRALRGLPERFATAVAAPLVFEGARVGALLLTLGTELGEEEHEAVAALGRLAAAALVNARRFSLTFSEARRDPLTGLANTRAFHEELDALLGGEASGGDVTLAILDLDDFKAINDAVGHPGGDRVLRQVSRVAQRSVRAGEEVFRVGGDEFAIILQGSAVAGTAVVDRIQQAAAAHRRPLRLPTISAGIATYPGEARTKNQLIERADRAMYRAKEEGGGGIGRYGGNGGRARGTAA